MKPPPVAPGSAVPGAIPTIAPATSVDTTSPSVAAATPPDVPPTCHLTKPLHPFVPPVGSAAPARPPDSFDAEWFGTARLWTILRHGGEVWYGLPHDAAGLGQKTFWWSADFDINREHNPAISVSGRQLDGPGRFAFPAPGTNAIDPDFGPAMLRGIDVPTTGCWQITATYRHASLSYMAWVSG
jgi:hypothetical protein